ncbi:MAG TPA: HAD-IIIC family phosphatase [Alphaproteobacteria bacterium]|jgi:FkbH-like protein
MMTLLQAKRLLAGFKGDNALPARLAMSGTADLLELHLRAEAAARGVALQSRTLPFGTLMQHLLTAPEAGVAEIILLLPWDFVPECDWRSGLAAAAAGHDALLAGAERVAEALARRPSARLAYLPAPIPPPLAGADASRQLAAEIAALAARAGARTLDPACFSMASYLANGCPIGGSALPAAGEALAELLLAPPPSAFKVLVTDADDSLWAGLVGEDGPDAVSAEPEGRGFRHFIYQTLMLRLQAAGILLAVVSRNDDDMVRAALDSRRMQVSAADFVAIRTGYGRKSDQLSGLAADLDLGLDSFVFVDDNPVELAEVAAALPQVTCVAFPKGEDELPAFVERLAGLFDRPATTEEDAERTALYRRRLETLPPAGTANLRDFLAGLDMRLTVSDRSNGDRQRPLQLINKTTQFNINGERLDDEQLAAILAGGGRLLSARLDDRSGSHGEVLACLLEAGGRVRSLVMSCRVLERRVEYAFLAWLAAQAAAPSRFVVRATARNEPAQRFLADAAFIEDASGWRFDGDAFRADHADDLALFSVTTA